MDRLTDNKWLNAIPTYLLSPFFGIPPLVSHVCVCVGVYVSECVGVDVALGVCVCVSECVGVDVGLGVSANVCTCVCLCVYVF